MQQNFPEPLNCATCGRIHTPITNQDKDREISVCIKAL
jgi:hypothetical protein